MTPLRSGIRVYFYALIGSILTSGVFSAIAVDGLFDVNALKKAGVSAVAAGVIGLLSYVYNLLEDNGVVPSTKGN